MKWTARIYFDSRRKITQENKAHKSFFIQFLLVFEFLT